MHPAAPTAGPIFDDAFRTELGRLFAWRRDVRRFRPGAVEPALLNALLATANLAPSVGLSQPWRFVLVEDPQRRAAIGAEFRHCNAEALATRAGDEAAYARLKLAGLEDAPCHLAVFADPDPAQGGGLGRRTMPQTATWSAVLAVHTLWLAARAAGLGVGWVSILRPEIITATLEADPAWQFVAYLCLGWPETNSETPELECAGWERRAPPSILRR